MSHPISEFKDEKLYLDTMILYALLRNIDPDVVKPFFQHIRHGNYHAFTSVLTFDELAYRLLLASIREYHKGNPLTHLRKNEAKMIAAFYPQIATKISQFQSFPNLVVLDITSTDLALMNQNILDYQIRPRDALHLAAMQKYDCFNLVSNDADFDRVSEVTRYTIP